MLRPTILALLVLSTTACLVKDTGADTASPAPEGRAAGDCADGADNDGDGDFDCEDDGCAGSPDCETDNHAPSIDSVTISPDPAVAEDVLICSYGGWFDEDGDADASTFEWSINGATAGTGNTLDGGYLGGDVVSCIVTPFDGEDAGSTGSASVTIANTPPVVSTLTLTPDPAYETDLLTCTPTTADVDGDPVSAQFTWSVDGTDPGVSSDTLDGRSFDRGQAITCTVAPSDGEDTGAPMTSNTVIISNTAPSVDSVEITPDPAVTGDTLTCTYAGFADDDDDGDASTFGWTIDGVAAGTDASLSGGFTNGSVVECTVTPHDGLDAGTPSIASITIANTPPVLDAVTLGPDPAYEADTLTCAPGATSDVDGTTAFTYTYAWSVDGADPGETSATLDGSSFDRGQVVFCTATPNDGDDDGAPVDSNPVTIANTIPAVTDVAISPDPAGAEDTLTCSWTFHDDDADTDASTVSWTVNATPAGTGPTLSGGLGQVGGDLVACTVTPNDGTVPGTEETASITIVNTPPVLDSVSLTPAVAFETDTLVCAPGDTSDADGNPFDYRFAWSVDGSDPGVTTPTLDGTWFDRDQVVTCTVTPTDGEDDGTPVTSDPVTISNTAPGIDTVSIGPNPAQAADTLTCSYTGYADVDGDPDASTFAWTVDGVSAGTTSEISGSYVGGSVVTCTVTPHDGDDAGLPITDSITITNTPPVLDSASLTPDPAWEEDILTCTPGTTTDIDGDEVTWLYTWSVDGNNPGAVGQTIDGGSFDRDQQVACTITPFDGSQPGAPVTSNTVTISNSAPSIASVTIQPDPATAEDPLRCNPIGYSDADGDADASEFEWAINGAVAGTGRFLDGGYVRDDVVTCTVTPHDGDNPGTPVSAAITIANGAPSLASVDLGPLVAYEEDTLTCAPGAATDMDGDGITFSYAWSVDGTDPGVYSAVLDGTSFDRDQDVTCHVTPTDGMDPGTPVSSNTVRIANSAPSIDGVTISPDPAWATSELTCSSTGYADPDGDPDTSSVRWTVNGEFAGVRPPLSGVFSGGDVVTCTVTPSDGDDFGEALATSITIENTPPEVTSITLLPHEPREEDTITAIVSTDDVDGDTVTITYEWHVGDGPPVQEGAAASLTGDLFSRYDYVWVTATPWDDHGPGVPMSSDSVYVLNTFPTAPEIHIDPESPEEVDDLVCTIDAESEDADGDGVNYIVTWEVDGAAFGGAVTTTVSGDTVLAADTDPGDTWTCTVTPYDDVGPGDETSTSVHLSSMECDSDGTFASYTLSGGLETQGYAVEDVDEDGHDDLVFNNQLDEDVDIYWGDGTGAYSTFSRHWVGRSGGGFDFGDIDNDGDIDAIFSNQDYSRLVWLKGTGGGGFSGTETYSQSGFPQDITLTDLNDDGNLDIVVKLRDGNCTASRMGDGAGGFASSVCMTDNEGRVRNIDADGDGKDELVQRTSSTELVLYTLDGAGNITGQVPLDTSECEDMGPQSIYDLDDDGHEDILVPCTLSSTGDLGIVAMYSDGVGGFEACVHVEGTEGNGAIGDFNRDGAADYILSQTCSFCGSTHTIYQQEFVAGP